MKAFGKSARGNDLWLKTRQLEQARNNPNFFLYIAENIRQGDRARFTLRVLGGERLHTLLRRAKEQHYYTVPWPVAQYDSCPLRLDGCSLASEQARVSEVSPERLCPQLRAPALRASPLSSTRRLRRLTRH